MVQKIELGMAARTRNSCLTALKGFCTWCVKNRRLTSNPLASVAKADEQSDWWKIRRAMTEAELARLLYVALWRPLAEYGRETVRKPASKVTGKRKTWNPAQLAFKTIDAAVDRAREKLAENPERIAELEVAGIPKKDDQGRTIDVHALRHTFGTMLSQNGVAPRTAQAAMRHSKIDLTVNLYTDPRLLDVAGAMDALPTMSLTSDLAVTPERVTLTGTDGQGESFLPPMHSPRHRPKWPIRGKTFHFGQDGRSDNGKALPGEKRRKPYEKSLILSD